MGQLGSAMTNPNTYGAQPSGMNGTDWTARIMGGGLKGAAAGLQNQPKPPMQGGPAMPVPMPQQPQVNLPMGGVQTNMMRKPDPSFYGQ